MEQKSLFYIYETTNLINNKIYVGRHESVDIENDPYIGSGTYFLKAVDKHRKQNFNRKILHVFNTLGEAEAKEAEIVNEDFVLRKDTYNLVIGGPGGGRALAALISPEIRKIAGIKAGIKLKGRTKNTHLYLKEASEKRVINYNNLSDEDKELNNSRLRAWVNDEKKSLDIREKAASKMRGRTKENDASRLSQSQKLSVRMRNGMAEEIAKQLRGRTKENDSSRLAQSQKISGENNPSKRQDVKDKLSASLSGSKNPSYGKYGEHSSSSKLTNKERLDIIQMYESGTSVNDIHAKYANKVKRPTIASTITKREAFKLKLKEQ